MSTLDNASPAVKALWDKHGRQIAADSMGERSIAARWGISAYRARRLAKISREQGDTRAGPSRQAPPPRPTPAPPPPWEIPDHVTPWDQRPEGRSDDLGADWEQWEEQIDPEEIIEQRAKAFAKKKAHADANAVRRIPLTIRGPYALAFVGDPHVDNPGCDWGQLRDDITCIAQTEGMYGVMLGDITDNWIGRLAKLYAKNPVTVGQSYALARWIFQSCPWALVELGNHDQWGDGAVILRHLMRGCSIGAVADHGIRIELETRDMDRPLRLEVRHDFRGHSMYNRLHGALKQSMFRPWADVLAQGHHHEWGWMVEPSRADSSPTTMIKAAGYKVLDDYAEACGFAPVEGGHAIGVIIDPRPATAMSRVRVIGDLRQTAEELSALRRRRAA